MTVASGIAPSSDLERDLCLQVLLLELGLPLVLAMNMWDVTQSAGKPSTSVRLPRRSDARPSRQWVFICDWAAGRINCGFQSILAPAGFDWRTSTAVVGAFAAEEVFVAQMGVEHALGETDEGSTSLRAALQRDYTPMAGVSIMLISMPCLATVAAVSREAGSWKWAAAQTVGLTVLAWVAAVTVLQIGSLLGIGT